MGDESVVRLGGKTFLAGSSSKEITVGEAHIVSTKGTT